MRDPNPSQVDSSTPIGGAEPPTPSGIRELPRTIILANGLVIVPGVLEIPVALGSVLGFLMMYGTAGGYENNPRGLLWFRSLFVTIVGFPIICATSVVMSFYLGCNGYHRSAVLVALLAPLVGIVTAVVLMAFDG